ncbi:IS5 family transposase [Cellulomonas sp. URHE0023]|uniref:IS5 family transposase n=1 Tax=Cellulomonas sp. URHE0023 TaxID=1380354 RepID=UPI003510712A
MTRFQVLTDEQWERIEPLLPSNTGKVGRPFGDHRTVVEGIAYRYRTGIPWRDLPREAFGPWQTVWKRHKKFADDGTWDRVLAQLLAEADAAGQIDWTVSVDSTINRAHQHATNTTRPEQDTGATSNHKKPGTSVGEPAGHGIGRSRGGLTSKIHHAVDGRGRPLAVVVTPGQSHDGRALGLVLEDIWVPRLGAGRPRTTPDAVLGDKAYSSRGNRSMLRRRGIAVVIPEPSDQQANRKRRGGKGGRPPKLDRETYKRRNVVERSFNLLKQWRGLATRYDKHATVYRAGAVLAAIVVWLRS